MAKTMTIEKKVELFSLAVSVAGIRFDKPEIIELLVELYDRMLELNGNIGLNELVDRREAFNKKMRAKPANIPMVAKKNNVPPKN